MGMIEAYLVDGIHEESGSSAENLNISDLIQL